MNNPIRPIVKCVNLPSKEVPCLFNINSSHMRKSTLYLVACMTATVLLNACQPKQNLDIKNALTFFASFDNGFDADYALGDKNIYTATSRRALDSAMKGMHIFQRQKQHCLWSAKLVGFHFILVKPGPCHRSWAWLYRSYTNYRFKMEWCRYLGGLHQGKP